MERHGTALVGPRARSCDGAQPICSKLGPLWIGTDIPAFEAHVKLLEELTTDPDAAVSEYAAAEALRLRQEIAKVLRTEALRRERDERFE